MNAKKEDPHEIAAQKARDELLKLQQQSEKALGAPATEKEAEDEGDAIERWGKRIGFGLSILMGIYVVWWFWDQIFN